MPARMEPLEARVSPQQKALWQRAALLEGRSLTDFVIAAAQEAPNRTLHRNEIIELTARDQALFVHSLLNPSSPGAPLRKAAQRYKQITAAPKK